jgi:bifunctional non-homologous end joining protein LigD
MTTSGPIKPMKAVLTHETVSGPGWVFERKLDGIRCIATKRAGGDVELRSRNDLSMNARYPEVAEALAADDATDFVVDGEVVAFEGSRTSFARLAERHRRPVRVYYYVFDVLIAGGEDVRPLPLLERKRILRRLLRFHGPIRYTPHRRGDGAELLRKACRSGWEGLIAKREDSPYVGARSRDWLKLKCSAEQELVVGGYTPPKGSRTDLGALLLGYYDGDRLRYAGKVGTGFNRATLRELAERLAPLRRESPPFDDDVPVRTAIWVEPELVVQVGFTEWTGDGRLRHPRFLGVREDKPAREVVREDRG